MQQNKYVNWAKMTILLIAWVMFTLFLMSKNEKVLHYRQLAIPKNSIKSKLLAFDIINLLIILFIRFEAYILPEPPIDPRLGLIFKGSFYGEHYDNDSTNNMFYYLTMQHDDGTVENITQIMHFPVVNLTELDTTKQLKRSRTVNIEYNIFEELNANITNTNSSRALLLNLYTNFDASFPINFAYDPSPLDKDLGIIYAAIVLLGLYIMIIWELVHRTFAAIIASTMSIGILAAMNERPPMTLIMSWIDIETLLLLFGMMILVAILSETGIFDYLAVYAYKVIY
jgi:hypothetical protein